ncbi:low molecular weight protein-tyrosine-phosphatase [Bacillus sp. DX4.1]|uniref:low molecular weight protein-tyrosine-phosphatase n=1 Tax=Bacillus sp. DX4.1 TaxID=3055867 RepID=UPI0025A15EA1|nr:low molecular weight protein-tyrosine-phosphatase [Bacillus sp. DX4.1]MDM5186929.1 low molecular weight protein-tyrosine-phosphatase [Bacillus sp. DX4.1]
MVQVLFVCLGNICRSPMAEAIFRDLVKREGLEDKIHIDSAGTGDWHIGHPPHEGTQKILKENEVSFEGIKARQVEKEDLTKFDYVIAMDNKNIADLESLGQGGSYIGRLSDFVPDGDWTDVPDPYFTGNFQEVYNLVTEGCTKLLTFICNEQGI